MTIRDRAKLLALSSRQQMRYCALQWRANRQSGSVGFMVTWLVFAAHHRRASAEYLSEYLEAA